jgi:toxin-antitoxin system PIN domain toxin
VTTYLLDVNLLLALADPMHVHHEAAHRWFGLIGRYNWATCPITENGFVRIASNPRYPNRPGDVATVLAILNRFCTAEGHHLWADNVSLRELLLPGAVLTHNHVTDVYLLGLAVHQDGKLATLDQNIPASIIQGGKEAFEFIES